MNALQGRCLCGMVRFAVQPPTLFCAHCHCRWCRAAHGAAFVTWVGADQGRFRLLPGSAEPRWYGSSEHSRRGFCGACGTTLFYTSTLCPGEIHVARTAFAGAIDREPGCHIFYDQRAPWFEAGDALPKYSSEEPALARFRPVPGAP